MKLGSIFTSLLTILGVILTLGGMALVFAVPVYLLWNWIMPELFGLSEITLIQAWGIKLLSSMLFKSSNTKSNE